MKSRLLGLIAFLFALPLMAEDKIQVLNEIIIEEPAAMMKTFLMKEANAAFQNWQMRYDELKTAEQIAEYQKQHREKFVESIGGFPERTPLNSQVTGIVKRKGYRVEKVMFESQPKHYVTGLCFIPDSPEFKPPYSAVLIVCGHSKDGKAYPGYQAGAALTALNGMIAFVVDPICQGERYAPLKEDGSIAIASSTTAHSLIGINAMLVGWNTARFEIWDAMRGIDYLQQRGDVDPEKIGCMGNSGGGTQTAYMMALEDRIQAASPSCYITTFERLLNTIGPQDAEQNIFGQLAWGMDHPDYLIMRAPVPILMCTATHDFFSIDGAWTSFRKAKRIYNRLGTPERVSISEIDAKHGWHEPSRKAAVRWMARWLDDRDSELIEADIVTLDEKEVQVSEKGQVQRIPGAKSAFDLNIDEYHRLEPQREKLWKTPESALQQVGQIAGIRTLKEIEAPKAQKTGATQIDGMTVEQWALRVNEEIVLPALLYRPAKSTQGPLLFVHEKGKQASDEQDGKIRTALNYAKAGHLVLAVDLRGTGETTPEKGAWYNKLFGNDGKLIAISYLLGQNFVGMRAEDILTSSRWFLEHEKLPLDGQKLTLVAVGNVGVPALHAAALEREMFNTVTVIGALTSWERLITSTKSNDQYVNCIHGALRAYDLSDLIQFLGDDVNVIAPVDEMGNTIKK